MKQLLIVVAACVALTACGGGGSSATPSTAKPASNAQGQLSFSILVPASTTTASATRRPAYVSPATGSVSFQLGTGTAQVVALTPGSATCPLGGSGYTCTATVNAPAGSAQLTVATYASATGTGPVLSTNTMAVTIVAAQNNPVNVTLNGVAASFAVSTLPTSVTEGTPSSLSVAWTALDASGNTIIGPGSIINASGTVVAPSLRVSDTTDFTVGAQTGNSWAVAYNGAVTTSPVTFTVANTGVTTAYAQATVTATGQRLFIANTGASDSVSVLDPPYTGTATVITNGTGAAMAPFEIAANASFDVFVPNEAANVVQMYAPPYTGAAIATMSTSLNSPYSLALDGSGDLFVENVGNDTVSMFAPPYTGAPAVLTTPACAGPALCFDQVGEQITTLPGTSEVVFPNDPYPTLGYASPYSTNTPSINIANGANNGGWGIAADSAGDLFVSYTATSTVVEYAPPYTVATATITSGVDQPRNISVDRSGNLFVANINSTVTLYAPPYTGAPTIINTPSTGGEYPWSTALTP
jgi:hypothetical protein